MTPGDSPDFNGPGQPSPPPLATFGNYVLYPTPPASGSMGLVYRGRHKLAEAASQQGDVAIKVLNRDAENNERIRERFFREGAVLFRLRHKNIVRCHELPLSDHQLALVMEWVDGRSLASLIADRGVPTNWAATCAWFGPVLEAIRHAHNMGVIHRDLKPANILISTDGTPKVVDFGVAKLLDNPFATQAGVTIGTLAYMAPDQHRKSERADQRSDIFSLAVVLYEALTCVLPWDGDEEMDLLRQKRDGVFASASSRALWTLPPHVDDAIQRALSPDPRDRFHDIAEFAEGLRIPLIPDVSTAGPEQASPPRRQTALVESLDRDERRTYLDDGTRDGQEPVEERSATLPSFRKSGSRDVIGENAVRLAITVGTLFAIIGLAAAWMATS